MWTPLLNETFSKAAGAIIAAMVIGLVVWTIDLSGQVDSNTTKVERIDEMHVTRFNFIDEILEDIQEDIKEVKSEVKELNSPLSAGGLSRSDRELLEETLDAIRRYNCYQSGGRPGSNTPLCRGIQ